MKHRPATLDGMHYFKVTSGLGADGSVDDYFEVDGEGVVKRVVTHAGGRWWASPGEDADPDELLFGDLEPVTTVTGDEFEEVWQLALADRPADHAA
jgi:hypothetical protein